MASKNHASSYASSMHPPPVTDTLLMLFTCLCVVASSSSSPLRHPHTSSSYRFPHLLLLSAVSMALVCLTGALFLRGQQTPYYLHPTSTVPVSDALWQLELAAQMKVSLLATIALVITIYTLLTLLLSVQLDAILHQHRQEYATSMQAEAAERKGKRIDRRVRSTQE